MATVVSDSSDEDLPENLNKLYLKACAAIELKNYGYAIPLLDAVLKIRPDFEDALLLADLARRKAGPKNE